MTDFHWPPDDIGHYLAMQGGIAEEVTPSRGEHTIIGERCGVSKYSVMGWRTRHGIPALQTEHGGVNGREKRRSTGWRKRGYCGPSPLDADETPAGGLCHREVPILSEAEFTALMDDRSFEDDPRAVEGRL